MVAMLFWASATVGCTGTREVRHDVAAPSVDERREGVVSSIDEEWLTLTLAERPMDPALRFRVDETTVVNQGSERLDRSAIEQGEVVRVLFDSRAGTEQAKSVEILGGDEAARIRARAMNSPPAWPRPERPKAAPTSD